ncbi:MAG: sigma-70 family RNA polymerase sigma factor [Cyclobacteriaceae bacterium]
MPDNSHIDSLVEHLFRHESGKMVAVLSRILGLQNLEAAQDIVQDTLIKALHTWKSGNLPDNPAGWLYKTAKNKAIDLVRREHTFQKLAPDYAYILNSDFALSSAFHKVFMEDEIGDSQLRMMFACCHPEIPIESQIALTLRTLGGLSTSEIASAFLTSEDTITKRIYRAKEKFRTEDIQMSVPQGEALPKRLEAVLKSIYLLFREGYHSSHPDQLIREDLCQEAMRLCFILTEHVLTAKPSSHALMALMCFQASRLKARLDDNGHIVLIRYQDRGKWYKPLINKGFHYLERASEPFEVSTYHLEALIASLHASAKSFETTEWKMIYEFYSMLQKLEPNPIVAMNKAIAAAYAIGFEHALKQLNAISGLENHPAYLASLGEIYFELGELELAKVKFQSAVESTDSEPVKELFRSKIHNCLT